MAKRFYGGKPTFSLLYDFVLFNKELSSEEKILWSYINRLSTKEGYCWASNAHFAEMLNVTERSVRRYISHLAEEELVFLECFRNSKGTMRKIYPYNPIPPAEGGDGAGKRPGGYGVDGL